MPGPSPAPSAAENAWRRKLEARFLAIDPYTGERLAQILRESRAAWLLLLPPPSGARHALLVGDARSGTAAGLVRLGWRVTLHDPSAEHRAFAKERGCATNAALEDPPEPLAKEAFDLVLLEETAHVGIEEAATLSRDLVAWTTDNALGYKRSSGSRGEFRTTTPFAFLFALLFRSKGRLGPRRAALARALGRPPSSSRAAALYPDRLDFAFAIDLDRGTPKLTIGPKERTNRLKWFGYRLGLFPLLAPSFALWARRQETSQTRLLDVLLRQLETELEVTLNSHDPEYLVATRGNTALIQTTGGWVLRVPLGHRPLAAARQNAAALEIVRERFPAVPVAAPLFQGDLRPTPEHPGVFVTVETRFPGLGAGQLSGNLVAMGRLTRELGQLLASLATRPAAPLDELDLEQLLVAPFRTVRERCGDVGTSQALDTLEAEVLGLARGLVIPRVACHRDLRPKHVIAVVEGERAGSLVGIVDWSAFDELGPPLYDLFHFIAQERAQRPGWSSARAWKALESRAGLEPAEREAIEAYETALSLPAGWYTVVAKAYPVLFGAMAEQHWDYSRPRWLKRLFRFGVETPSG